MNEIIEKLVCIKCGWTHEMVGMKPECPECQSRLYILKGTKEEIDNKVKELMAKYSK